MVSVRDFGAVGDGIADDSAAFTAAIAEVERRQRGGVVKVPAGIFRARIDASKLTADFEKRVTIRGAGRGATQIKPTATGDIILNMVGRNVMTVEDLTIYAGEEFQAYAGVVLARTDGSPNCNNNKFMNVEVIGNFAKAGVVSIAAESGEWHNCRFFMSSGGSGVAIIIGSDPHAANVSLEVPGVDDLRRDANTDTRWIACEFQSYQAAEMVRLSAFHSHHFIGSSWIAPYATRLTRFCDPDSGALGGGTTFTDCHFEGLTATGSVFSVDMAGATAYLFGISERASTIVTTQGSTFLDYDRTDPRNLLVLQQCDFAPAGPPNTTQTGIHFYADLIDRSVIDYTRLGDRGTLFCFL